MNTNGTKNHARRFAQNTIATLAVILVLALSGSSAHAAVTTVTVTGTGDTIAVDGVVTLREAICAVNTNKVCGDAPAGSLGFDIINFNIPGPGVHTITPLSPLPPLEEPVKIDGYSQPGSSENSLSNGDNALLLIELNGLNLNAAAGPAGFTVFFGGSGSTFRGLVINRFTYGIYMAGGSLANLVEGCFIGTDPTGLIALGNRQVGVSLDQSNSNRIGGTTPAARNLISGNGKCVNGTCTGSGVSIFGANILAKNLVQGNFIGTDRTGTVKLGNASEGILLGVAQGNTIGGSAPGARNVVSGNPIGISLKNSVTNQIAGNLIGTDAAGNAAVANNYGVMVSGGNSGNTIGGTTAAERNIISGNSSHGVVLGSNTILQTVVGNYIGTDITGLKPLGNGDAGVFVDQASSCLIGGIPAGAGNRIAYNAAAGIYLYHGAADTIYGNEIYANGGLGIDLFATGVNPNDPGDADTGVNDLQNYPVLNSAIATATQTTISGTLNSSANTTFRVELFANPSCDSSGSGEGRTFIGSTYVTTSGNVVNFNVTVQGSYAGQFISATATTGANTSEFSACRQVVPSVLPTISISDASQVEGNQGNINVDFNVTLSLSPVVTVTVNYVTAPGTATNGNDYQPTSGTLTFNPGETVKTVTALINGDTQVEPNETFFVNLSNPGNATIQKGQGKGTILDDDAGPPTVQFSKASYQVQEDLTALIITVTRSGDTSGVSSVEYTTTDGTAKQQGDYEFAAGTLNFAAGETSKTFALLINEDSYGEGDETLALSLSKPVGASLGQPGAAVVTIKDDALEQVSNPNDEAQNFVYQQYHDFLNREPDASGLAFWTNEITSCVADAQCIESKRVNVSAAFFLSKEFQETGYLAYRFYKAAYGNLPGAPVPVSYNQFLRDTQQISKGVQVGIGNWQTQLENNKNAFASDFVTRPAFVTAFPQGLTADQFVDALNQNAGGVLSQAKRDQLVNDLSTNTKTRAQVVRAVAEDSALVQLEFNKAFVLIQYFGYLRRNPNSAPDTNFDGYQFWLNKLSQFNGNFIDAEMVKAFIDSAEYQDRFSALHSH